jgi:Zn-dependent M28 family amino/carboxypeptidase
LAAIRRLAPHVLRSDHAPFWEAGIPALMWTDTAEFRNPNYHSTFDTPETLDYDSWSVSHGSWFMRYSPGSGKDPDEPS